MNPEARDRMSSFIDPSYRREDITYCTNVHPGQSAEEILHNLKQYVSRVKRRRGLSEMAAGIWIGARALEDLQDERMRRRFRECLEVEGLWPTSINGFPYGSFHRDRVKEEVYEPAWDSSDRVRYTRGLAVLAAELLVNAPPRFRKCSISTVPLGFRSSWNASRQAMAVKNLIEAERHFARIASDSGIRITLGLEMEPGCALEKTSDVLLLWQDLRAAGQHEAEGIDDSHARGGGVSSHLGLCYDVCHQAVMFEDISESLSLLGEAHIPIFKYQISSALRVLWPSLNESERPDRQPDSMVTLEERLIPFCEERYLHQTCARGSIEPAPSQEGISEPSLRFYVDLDKALADRARRGEEWRIHFHVPVHLNQLDDSGLYTTRDTIEELLNSLATDGRFSPNGEDAPVLEVETYTWEVLPDSVRNRYVDLVQAIVQELVWLEKELQQRDALQEKGMRPR